MDSINSSITRERKPTLEMPFTSLESIISFHFKKMQIPKLTANAYFSKFLLVSEKPKFNLY